MEQKNKHLTLEQRHEIEEGLIRNLTFKKIGSIIGKNPTTVSKEIKKHIIVFDARNHKAMSKEILAEINSDTAREEKSMIKARAKEESRQYNSLKR